MVEGTGKPEWREKATRAASAGFQGGWILGTAAGCPTRDTVRTPPEVRARMMSSNLWKLVLAVWLVGCAGSAPSLRSKEGTQPAVMTGEEACRDPTALVLLCGEHVCAFYPCRAVALVENAPREVVPYGGAPAEDASVQTAAPGKVVLALAGVEEAEQEAEAETLAEASSTRWWAAHTIGLGDTEPVFVFQWGQLLRPHPFPPSLQAYAEQLARLPHVEHHIFPPEGEFQAWFASKGIDPEAWTIPVLAEDYFRIHEGAQGDSWNAAWREFMRATPQATATDVWSHAGELCLRFGVFEPVFAGPIPPPRAAGEETVTFVRLDPATEARADKALAECADLASKEVLARLMNGRNPTPQQCREVVGRDAKGRPITRAMQLGIEMHDVALDCARRKLGELRPFGFSIEPRYRYDPQTERATPVSPEVEQDLLRRGLGSELLGTIVPDVVLHAGNPARVQEVYDFKFPCVDPEKRPDWGRYPEGHPYQKRSQGEVYQEALGAEPARVTPRKGVIR